VVCSTGVLGFLDLRVLLGDCAAKLHINQTTTEDLTLLHLVR
jgi:hypothetical protein